MRRARVLVGLLAAPVLALGAVAPAATAAPLPASAAAVHAALAGPASLTRCDIRFNFCRIIDNTAHPRFINGTARGVNLIGSTTGTLYTAKIIAGTTVDYVIKDQAGLCWNQDSSDHIDMAGCNGFLNEEWEIVGLGDANHDSTITNLALNSGNNNVNCCEPETSMWPSAIRFLTDIALDGTSSWYWVTG